MDLITINPQCYSASCEEINLFFSRQIGACSAGCVCTNVILVIIDLASFLKDSKSGHLVHASSTHFIFNCVSFALKLISTLKLTVGVGCINFYSSYRPIS